LRLGGLGINMQKFYFYKQNGKYIAMGIEPSEHYENEIYYFEDFATAEAFFNNGEVKK
jgi:hypothetical protein